MDFKDTQAEGKKHGVGNSDFMRLEDGENKVRVLCFPEAIATHFPKGQKPVTCTMDDHTCPLCKEKVQKSVKVMLYVIDRADETIKVGEFPWSVFTGLGDLSKSSEFGYKGLPPYDVIITKKGSGMKTEYGVLAGKNEDPITDEQTKEFEAKKPIIQIVGEKIEKAQADAVSNFDEFVNDEA